MIGTEGGWWTESYLSALDSEPSAIEAAKIKAAIRAIPDDILLLTMACPISPESSSTCLVCRLVEPEKPYKNSDHDGKYVWDTFAERYGITLAESEALFSGAWAYTTFVEELIADRLDDIVFGKSVGQAA